MSAPDDDGAWPAGHHHEIRLWFSRVAGGQGGLSRENLQQVGQRRRNVNGAGSRSRRLIVAAF